VKAKKNRKTGRWSATLDLRKVKASRFTVKQKIRTSSGKTVTRTKSYARCPAAQKQTTASKKKKA
jgi:hypothetical protein